MTAFTVGRATAWFDWRLLLLTPAALVLLVRPKAEAISVVVGAGVICFLIGS
jgi:hypothetical protein